MPLKFTFQWKAPFLTKFEFWIVHSCTFLSLFLFVSLSLALSLYALVKLMSRKLNSIQGFNFETLILVCLALKHVLLHDNVSHLVRWSYLITKDNNRIYLSIRILSLFWFMPSFFPRPSFLSFYVWFHYVSRICCYWSLSLHFSWPIIDENESWNP